MGFMGGIGNVFKSIGSGIKSIGGAALRAVAPQATNLLKNIVGSGFDAFKGMATKLVGNLTGPIGSLAQKYLTPLLGKGIDALKGMSTSAIESLIKKLTDTVAARQVPGAAPGAGDVTVPALGTPERASSTHAATAAVDAAVATASNSRIGPAGQGAEDQFANAAAGLHEPVVPGEGATEGQMVKYQAAMQKYSRMMDMYSKMIQAQHDMKKGIIANFRV